MDGSVYMTDYGDDRVRKIPPDGIINTVAGTGPAGTSGNGGPATNAQLNYPSAVAVTPDGGLVITESGGRVVRKVASDGTISTIAGTGVHGFVGDGGPAV